MCVQDAVGRQWFRSCPKGPANMTTVLSVAIEIAAGMSYLHDRGIIHGDLSAGEARLILLLASFKVGALPQTGHQHALCMPAWRACRALAGMRPLAVSWPGCHGLRQRHLMQRCVLCRQHPVGDHSNDAPWLLGQGVRLWHGARNGHPKQDRHCHDRHRYLHAPGDHRRWHGQQGEVLQSLALTPD